MFVHYLLENEFQKACDKYTEAINIYPTAILYCKGNTCFHSSLANRSFCYFKLECCGDALRDASKAIELDPNYEKGYSLVFIS